MNMFTWFIFKRKIKEELKLKRKLMRKYLKWKKKNFKNIDDPFVRVKLDGADISDDKIQALEASGNFWEREGFDAAEIKKTCSEKNVFSFILKKKYKNGLSVIKDKWKGTDNTDKSYCLTKLSWYIFLTEKKQYKYLVRQYAIKSWITEHYETVYFKLKKKDDKLDDIELARLDRKEFYEEILLSLSDFFKHSICVFICVFIKKYYSAKIYFPIFIKQIPLTLRLIIHKENLIISIAVIAISIIIFCINKILGITVPLFIFIIICIIVTNRESETKIQEMLIEKYLK